MAGPGSYSTAFGSIPFADVPEGTDVAKNFLAGATLGATINKNRQQLENQLQQLVLRNQAMELNQYNRDRNFQLASYLGNEKLDIARQRAEGWQENAYAMRDIQQQRADLQEQITKSKLDAAAAKVQQANAMFEAGQIPYQLDQEGIQRGTKEWLDAYNERRAKIYGLPNAAATAIDRNALKSYGMDSDKLRREGIDKEKSFYRDVQDKIWGDGITTDLNPILNPDNPAYKHPLTGVYGFRKPVQDQVIIGKIKTPAGVTDRIVSVKMLNDMKKQWEKLQAEKSKAGPPINDPNLGVYQNRQETDQEKGARILRDTTIDDRTKRAAQALIDPTASEQAKRAARALTEGQ